MRMRTYMRSTYVLFRLKKLWKLWYALFAFYIFFLENKLAHGGIFENIFNSKFFFKPSISEFNWDMFR